MLVSGLNIADSFLRFASEAKSRLQNGGSNIPDPVDPGSQLKTQPSQDILNYVEAGTFDRNGNFLKTNEPPGSRLNLQA